MKTAEQALTEWVSDDILFNYVDGRGVIHHNRDQFMKVCNVFRAGDANAEPEATTAPKVIASGSMNTSFFPGAIAVSGFLISGSQNWEVRRNDITKVIGWNSLSGIHAASAAFRALLQKKLGEVEPWIESQIRGFFDPRKVSRFENARELIDHIIKIGQSITIKGQ